MRRLASALAAIGAGVALTLASVFFLVHVTAWVGAQAHGPARLLATVSVLLAGAALLVASVWVAVRIAVVLAPRDPSGET